MANSAERFGRHASNYMTSEVHRSSASLDTAGEWIEALSPRKACDVACGGGHFAAKLLDKGVPEVLAIDPSPEMLHAAGHRLQSYGGYFDTAVSPAEQLPLEGGSVDAAVSRLAAHHFRDIRQAIRELARVTAEGGHVIVIDLQGFDDPSVDELNHRIELLHDPTHVRSYRHGDWVRWLEDAGFRLRSSRQDLREREGGVPLWRWCEIAESGAVNERSIRELLCTQSEAMLQALGITRDEDDFRVPVRTALYVAQRV